MRLWGDHRANIRCAVSAVLRLIGNVYLVTQCPIGTRIYQRHILRYPASLNASLWLPLDLLEPGRETATVGSQFQVITHPNDLDGDRLVKHAILLESRKLEFLCCSNSFEIMRCPTRHCNASFV